MALPDYEGTITYMNGAGAKTTQTINLKGDETLAKAKLANVVAAVKNLSGARVQKVTFAQVIETDNTLPAGHIDLKVKASFNFLNADGLVMNTAIPGIKTAFLIPNTELVDLQATEVAAFTSEMITGNIVCDSRAIDVTGIKSAVHTTK